MADFRKLVLVLAVVAALAVPASAQVGFSCATTPTTPLLVRENGLTELVGAVEMVCQGGVDGQVAQANIQVFMVSAPVTNRVATNAACPAGFACLTDATLTITGALPTVIPGLLQQNLVPGGPNNSILFPNVVLPQGTTSIIRIENIRVAAPAASGTFFPSQIFELVSTSPATAFPITNPQQLVAFVQPGLIFTTDEGDVSFPQCVSKAIGSAPDFQVTFTEGFPSSFKNVDQEGPDADDGTLLQAVFQNVPQGLEIFVSEGPIAGTATLTAQRTATTGATVTINSVTYRIVPISGRTGTASWRVTGSNLLGTAETASFGVAVRFTADPSNNRPELTGDNPGTVSGRLGPTSTVEVASTTAPIPRFREDQTAGSVTLSIVPCVTNLLFPFVTNRAGFDTGIALVNTSLDDAGDGEPFETNSQEGTCTVYYFDGTTTAPAPQVTNNIGPGEMATFTLQGGGVNGVDATPLFQGYLIARCNFQYAHGFAFITDLGNNTGAHGYLALVIPDRANGTRPADPFTEAGPGTGEMLGQ